MRTRGADATPATRARAKTATLAQQTEAFLATLQAHHYSQTLLSQARLTLDRLASYLDERGLPPDVRQVREEDLLGFLNVLGHLTNRSGARLSLSTLNVYTNILRRFFAYLEASGVILESPAAGLPFHRIDALPRRVLSGREMRQLLGSPDAGTALGMRDRAILETLYGTAIRVSECHGLDLRDVDLRRGVLLVRLGKGRKDRMVPVPRLALEALVVYVRDARPSLVRDPSEAALFLTRRGKHLTRIGLASLVKGHGLAVGLRVSPHSLRHACATHLLKGGADVRHVQQLLGHHDIRTTALYTRVDVSDLRKVLERAHPREREAGHQRQAGRRRTTTPKRKGKTR